MTSASNSGNLRAYTARELIEEATSRCGIKAVQLTSEVVEKSLDQLNLMFPHLLNRGIQLWKRQRMILPVYVGNKRVQLPVGVNVAAKLTRRTLFRGSDGVAFSTPDGIAANAFDDNFDTSCEHGSAGGTLGMIFSKTQRFTTVGIKFSMAGPVSCFIESSNDGLVWTPTEMVSGIVSHGQWLWHDIDESPNALQWRIRSVEALPLSIEELYFGHTPSEIVIDPWNLDDYNAMPNKESPGSPLNYYQQRDLDAPYLLVWPVPDKAAGYTQLVVWAQQYLDTVSDPTQSLDLPRRWYEAITAELARRLCRSLPEADLKRYPMLKVEEQEAIELAEGEERDNSPTNYDMGLDAYTA